MAIQNIRSNTPYSVPPALVDGQVGVQQADEGIAIRRVNGTVRMHYLPKRRAAADAPIVIDKKDTYIGISALTAGRTFTLPAASAYQAGSPLVIADEAGQTSPAQPVTVQAAAPDTINGVASYLISTPFSGVLLFSDGISKWTTLGQPPTGAANALLYVPQGLSAGLQDQARSNLGGAVPASPSASTPLVLLDIERDQYVAGTSTIQMPQAAPGWRSGIVANDNQATGIITLSVPSGHYLDGAQNGVTLLFPKQRARLRMTASGAWRTDWVERRPVLFAAIYPSTAPATTVDIDLPVGYGSFDLIFHDVITSANNGNLQARLSDDGGATFKAGSSDYGYQETYGTNASVAGAGQTTMDRAYLTLQGINSASANWMGAAGDCRIFPGSTINNVLNNRPVLKTNSFYVYSAGNFVTDIINFNCTSISTRANKLRLMTGSGTFTGGFTLYGNT